MSSTELRTIRATDPVAEGCPVLTKTRSVTLQRGIMGIIEWNIRDKNGTNLDLSDVLCNAGESEEDEDGDQADDEGKCGSVNVKFQDVFGVSNILQEDGVVVDQSTGLITVEIPPVICNTPAIYYFNVGVLDADGNLVFMDRGILSVERTTFGVDASESGYTGPLTIGEIRMQLRDTAIENNLLDNVEFDDAEIIHSMIQPIREWNETPPPIGEFTPYNFPSKYWWLMATCANLMKIAAGHYFRNDLQASHGGIQVGDKAKGPAYLQVAQQMTQEWREWMRERKVSINASMAYGSLGSTYGRSYWN